jgi:hypothetical protein
MRHPYIVVRAVQWGVRCQSRHGGTSGKTDIFFCLKTLMCIMLFFGPGMGLVVDLDQVSEA